MRPHGLVRWPPWAVLAGAALVVHFYGLYRPDSPPSRGWFLFPEKVKHAIGFGVPLLLVLLTLAVRARSRGRQLAATPVLVAVGLFGAHAVVSEVIQSVSYRSRTGDPLDVLADVVGVALGVATFGLVTRGALLSRAPT